MRAGRAEEQRALRHISHMASSHYRPYSVLPCCKQRSMKAIAIDGTYCLKLGMFAVVMGSKQTLKSQLDFLEDMQLLVQVVWRQTQNAALQRRSLFYAPCAEPAASCGPSCCAPLKLITCSPSALAKLESYFCQPCCLYSLLLTDFCEATALSCCWRLILFVFADMRLPASLCRKSPDRLQHATLRLSREYDNMEVQLYMNSHTRHSLPARPNINQAGRPNKPLDTYCCRLAPTDRTDIESDQQPFQPLPMSQRLEPINLSRWPREA